MSKLTFYTLLVLFSIILTACRKDIPKGQMEGQIALTFDDASVENWHPHLPLLDSLKIKATFYISSYHTLNKHEKSLLKDIERHGHEIAYHTANHPDLPKEIMKKGWARVEEKEIKSDLRLMRQDGYNVTNFAYPYGSHNSQLNTLLLRTFKSVRALSNRQNYYKSLVKQTGTQQVFYGANVDNNSRLKDDKIISLMNDAQYYHDCLVLVAHQIENKSIKLQISRERLQLIARTAYEKKLEFITISQITQ
jgi:peptidoglycan/xylan/chitin deacetylase (PgdA/CDA1 family)